MANRRWPAALLCCVPLLIGAAVYPRPQGFVNDFAGVIDPATEARIAAVSESLQRGTGIELAVVTVASYAPEAALDAYAAGLFQAWGIGSAARDTGLLLIMAVGERQVRIEVGYGLEPVVTDGRAGAILDTDILPSVRRGEYGEGLARGAEALARLAGAGAEGAGAERAPPRALDAGTMLLVGGLILFLLLTNKIGRSRRGGWRQGGGWTTGGFGGFGGGGGFGGFGGGGSGGGGAGRGW
ncbi:MAG: TPM domain-containing protein [Nitrospiria bacterium]